MDKVSVIIPAYNIKEYINDCVYAVLNQKHQNFEILLINDGSDKENTEYLNQIAQKDLRIKIYHIPNRKGVAYARNLGLEKAQGDFLYFLDGDDLINEYTIFDLVKNIGSHNIACGKIKRFNNLDDINSYNHTEIQEKNINFLSENQYLKRTSVLNILFRREFIMKNGIRFSEKTERYTDLSFIIASFIKNEKIPFIMSSVYFKRIRNDPITNPALMQMGMDAKISDFLFVLNELKEKYSVKNVNQFLDTVFLKFYRKNIFPYFNKIEHIDQYYSNIVKLSRSLEEKNVRKVPFIYKQQIKILRKDKIKKYKKVVLLFHRLRKLKNAIKSRRKLYIQLYRSVFLKMPVKENLIVFESFLGKSYSDSPKYIYEYMVEKGLDFKYVWIFREKKKDIPGNPTQVKRFSLKYYYYLGRAKYWVSNSRIPKSLTKRQENIYLQTWHGTPLKTLVFDIKDIYSANPNYKKDFYLQSRRWDYLSSANQYSSDIFRRAFKYEKELLEFGYPRNDILYKKNNQSDIIKIKKKLNLPLDKTIILYAPTWRDDEFFGPGQYKFNLQLDLKKLQQSIGDKYVLILRMHYFIASKMDVKKYEGFVYDFSDYDDIAELYLVSDVLITDYSSVFFDYANLKRPILFFTYDIEKYRDKLRGFYFDLEKEAPGPIVKTTEEIIFTIKHIDDINKKFKGKYDGFYKKFCEWDDGNATKKTVEKVFLNRD